MSTPDSTDVQPPHATTQTRQFVKLDEESADAPQRRSCCHYGWVIWAVITLGQITTFFGTSSGVTFVVDDLMADLQLSRSFVSLAYAVGTFIGAATQIPIGHAVDRFGGQRSIAVCSAAFYVSLAAMSLPQSWVPLTLAFAAMRS